MSGGRTSWFAKDAAWWRRSRVTRIGMEHGPLGPAVLDWLTCEAKAQGPLKGHDGTVKAGYAAIAYGCFSRDVDAVQAVIRTCVEVGALDDFEEHGETFTCRISGWRQNVEMPLEAARKAAERQAKREQDKHGQTGTSPPLSTVVPIEGEVEGEEGPEGPSSSLRSEGARGGERERAPKSKPDPESLPDDLPERLAPVVDDVLLPALRRVAAAKGAYVVTRLGVGRLVCGLPAKPHADAVAQFEQWQVHGRGARKSTTDVVAAYRNWVKKEPDVTGPVGVATNGHAPFGGESTADFVARQNAKKRRGVA